MKVERLTEAHMKEWSGAKEIKTFFNDKDTIRKYSITHSFAKKIRQNIILLNCIDTNASEAGWIKAEDVRNLNSTCLVGKNTSRNIAYVMIPGVSLSDQEKMITLFNFELNRLRKEYNSLFLTNFRDNNRKRVSFDFCYKLLAYCYDRIKTTDRSDNVFNRSDIMSGMFFTQFFREGYHSSSRCTITRAPLKIVFNS
jgi:hypothetical protein